MSDSNAMPWRLVIAGCIGMFAATATGSTRAPFLPDIAADLGVSLPAVANLFGVTATAWGVSSYLVGLASSRLDRRIFLVGSPVGLMLTMFAIAYIEAYWSLVALVILSGMCSGAFTAAVLAEVSLRAHTSHHGRAFGYVMSGQSLTLLMGVPLAAWSGAIIGWRGTHVALAGLALFAVMCMLAGLGRTSTPAAVAKDRAAPRVTLREALTGPVIRLFMALVAERISFGLAAFYYAAYLRTEYDLTIDAVALPLVGFALGNISGTIVGGQVADRFARRRLSFAIALATAGCIAIPWFLWRPGVPVTVALGVLFAFFNALARPPLLAALAEVPAEVRGVVMGLNSSVASIGWLTAALVGGWLYSGIGFEGFSPLMAIMCIAGAVVVLPWQNLEKSL